MTISATKMTAEPCKEGNEEKVALVKVVEDSEATGKVQAVYEDIKKTLGIDFIPNMYKAMANNPDYLVASWGKIQATMSNNGKIDNKTKDIVAFIVSVMSGSTYCIGVYTDALRNNGLDDEALTELYSIVDTYAGLNRLNIASGVKPDKKPWHGCGGNR
jgi:AhpD family alkylhydroperoxidase